MERLQKAIEKARTQRGTSGPTPTPGPSNARSAYAARRAALETEPQSAVDAAWENLAEIKLNERHLTRNRVVTVSGGSEAAAYDLLRTRILQQVAKNGWKRVAFVSPHSGCGKSTTVGNLAFSLGRKSDTRALVLDADLRKRGLTSMLSQQPETGLAAILSGEATFEEHGLRYGTNLAFALNEKAAYGASEILQGQTGKSVLAEIEATYQPDVVLFDLPPLMMTDDSYGVLTEVDAALILAAADRTTMSQIDVSERQVAELTNVMGVVLNQCRYMGSTYGQDYYYG